ncbi:MAG: peptidoglycan DD-metalloendopeptidase family protein [Propionibacteriaceae bacterium]|nr:peptidoglycan DD-metalloendopeptidase family protein [Propionibacteriaceae bacterium]
MYAVSGASRRPVAPRRGRTVVTSALVVLATSLAAPVAHADTLAELRAAAATAQANQNNAQQAMGESNMNLDSATAALANSQAQLSAAQAVLADLQVQLSAARERDAQLAEELAAAQAALEEARAKVAQGEADVAAQQKVIVGAVTESYQQRTDLEGLSVVFGSQSTAELGQRIQWNTTIFDAQAAQKARLDAILLQLEQDRDEAAALEQQVANAKAEAEANVLRIADLEAQAAAQRQAVAALVSANEAARQSAAAQLAADEAAFSSYQAEEDRLQSEIQGELARLKAEAEARERAEREARERAAREAAAKRAAEAAQSRADAQARSAAKASQSSTSNSGSSGAGAPASSSSSTSRTGARTSSVGFIRPINASPGSAFGLRFHPILKVWRPHNGNDWGAATGTPIYAAQSGAVLKAGPNGGFGNFVLIGHGNLVGGKYVTTGYAHQSRIAVSVGQRVERGQLIGYVGNTGLSTTPHLHFEVRLDGVPVNPMLYLP